MYGDTFLAWLAGAYTLRAIWNHGHHRDAVLIATLALAAEAVSIWRKR